MRKCFLKQFSSLYNFLKITKKRSYFLILISLLLFFVSCQKDKNNCKPNIANFNFLNTDVSFAYNFNNNYLFKVVDSNLLDSMMIAMDLDVVDNENLNGNIIGLSLLFNTNDKLILNTFTENDLDGIIYYVYNPKINVIKTEVYKKALDGNFVNDVYLSTNISYVSSNDISKLSNHFSNGVIDNVKMLILTNDFGDFVEIGKTYYSEFTNRVTYVDNTSSHKLVGGSNCGGLCVEELSDSECWVSSSGIGSSCFDKDDSPMCPHKRGYEVATPYSYTTSQINIAFDKERKFRNEVLLYSKKGVTYTSLFYYIGSKLSNSYLIANFISQFDVIYNNLLPIIDKINDDSYTGVLYSNNDLINFINIIESIKEELSEEEIIIEKLDDLKQDLICFGP